MVTAQPGRGRQLPRGVVVAQEGEQQLALVGQQGGEGVEIHTHHSPCQRRAAVRRRAWELPRGFGESEPEGAATYG
ncbi:hypothetical protein GCM10010346_33690 [Streptomyces chryseus]|uniref:Uncharacterized protein n=1 Tax=Streptomyces chryseus TaxID=68186 RepID=A0ABQ3DPR3_9ACTN|nr:hypothetical protein GCM10010346_33690 [Streptomyces chryseus]